ncbi:lysophospholipid acyltransferase family protein [Roseofilum casamattae]|uniref:1-acyl-sn-glycerol-3-phosphate acyltransferase n=1 Tax=Roseofilum casamattae BLCC-M143 TaxID=3022442 RepID=A0ABT7BXS5_9CYAN|nr:1-acyl-sn-glycerol-3-phosphate acyltransferase [Roseofilum casamattae]MDJ1183083.1 1-acyl-sn-glycerol-3-phosphate acyltransferase [Roseofilum casamattae BLCC-M143]
MSESIIDRIQPPLNHLPPQFNPWVLRSIQFVLPWWLRYRCGISKVETHNVENLARLYRQFQQRQIRLLLAFRHPSTNDPFSMAHLLWNAVPKAAKREKIALKSPVHCHFMYDRGIALWAGKMTGNLFSRLGGTSIQRGKLDREGLKCARNLLVDGRFPLALAPEGGVNDHSELMSPLEPGLAQLAFWCLDDLYKANREEQVAIVPIGIRYSFVQPPWEKVDALLTTLENDLNLAPISVPANTPPEMIRYRQLLRIGQALLGLMEAFYVQFYDITFPELPEVEDVNQAFSQRLHRLLEAALNVSESYFKITPKGTFLDRCRRLEQAGWERIYRSDIDTLSPVECGLGNWIAEEASLRMGHMRIVERVCAVTGKYVREKQTAERFAETLLILWKVINWIKTGIVGDRPDLGAQAAALTVGEPLWVNERWSQYKKSRRNAVSELTQDLQTALQELMDS